MQSSIQELAMPDETVYNRWLEAIEDYLVVHTDLWHGLHQAERARLVCESISLNPVSGMRLTRLTHLTVKRYSIPLTGGLSKSSGRSATGNVCFPNDGPSSSLSSKSFLLRFSEAIWFLTQLGRHLLWFKVVLFGPRRVNNGLRIMLTCLTFRAGLSTDAIHGRKWRTGFGVTSSSDWHVDVICAGFGILLGRTKQSGHLIPESWSGKGA